MKNGDRPGSGRLGSEGDGEAGDGGIASAGRAFGRAIGFFRRLTPKKSGEQPAKVKTPKPPRRGKLVAPAAREQPPAELAVEIARLETELDTLHAGIGAGHGSDDPGRSAEELDRLVRRARSLRETLKEKHRLLARVERTTARERRLASRGIAGEAPAIALPAANGGRKSAESAARIKPATSGAQVPGSPASRDAARDLLASKLQQELESADPEVRRLAANRIGDLQETSAVRALTRALEDPVDGVRIAALNALARVGSAPVEVFTRFLQGDNHHLRLAALRGLAQVGGAEVVRFLVEALEDDEPLVSRTAATLLGWREARDGVMPLAFALRHASEEVRGAAARSLGSIRDDRATLSLIRALEDPTPEVRDAALLSLRAILGQQVPFDLEGDLPSQVAELKSWWRQARVDARLGQLQLAPLTAALTDGAVPALTAADPEGGGVVSLPRPRAVEAVPSAAPAATPLRPVAPVAAKPVAPAAAKAPVVAPAAGRTPTPAEPVKVAAKAEAPSLDAILSGEVDDLPPGVEGDGSAGIDAILSGPFEGKSEAGEESGLDSLLDQDLVGSDKKSG